MDELGSLAMSASELNRLEILGRVLERRLMQTQAAEQLDRVVRQVEMIVSVSSTGRAPRPRFEETRKTE